MTKQMNKTSKYYFYDDASKIIYYCEEMPLNEPELIYVGTSDNQNVKMAAAAFMSNMKVSTGYTIKELIQ